MTNLSKLAVTLSGAMILSGSFLAGSIGFAEDNKSTNKPSGTIAANEEEDRGPAGEGMSTMDTRLEPPDVAPSAGTSNLALPTATTVESKAKYGLDLDLELDARAAQIRDQAAGGLSSQNFISARAAIGQSTVVYLRPQFASSYAPPSQSKGQYYDSHNDWKMGDTILGIADTKIATFAKEGSVSAIGRVYLPTAEADRITGNQGSLYGRMIVTAPINSQLTLGFNSIALWWNQSSDTYIRADGGLDRNLDYELTDFGSITWAVVKHLDLSQNLGMDYTFFRKSGDAVAADAVQVPFMRNIYFETMLSTDIIPHISTILGMLNEPLTNNPNGTETGFLREGETYFYLNVFASL